MASITTAQGDSLLSAHDGWVAANAGSIQVESADVRVASTFVRRFELGLRTPDALHIAICHRFGSPLFTFDQRQAAAAAARRETLPDRHGWGLKRPFAKRTAAAAEALP